MEKESKPSKSVKLEKITLWTSVQTYNMKSSISSLDYILDNLDDMESECVILDYGTEDYELIKKKK